MLKYNNPIKTQEGYILSIDKVRLLFKFKTEKDSIVFRFNVLNNFKTDKGLSISLFFSKDFYSVSSDTKKYQLCEDDFDKAKPSFVVEEYIHNGYKYGSYRFMYNVHPFAGSKETIVIAHQLNNSKNTMLEGFVEFNPNKVAGEVLDWILKTLRFHCSYLILKRYDLALDVPCRADYITLHKDERKYELHRPNGTDISKDTEYLGRRNEEGRFKKYNKKEEHNKNSSADEQINDEITRLELTLATFDYCKAAKLFPKLEIVDDNVDLISHINYLDEFEKLCATDKVLVQLLQESEKKDLYFSQLGRDKKNKIRPYLYGHFKKPIILHEEDFNRCISKMKKSLNLFNTNASNKLIR